MPRRSTVSVLFALLVVCAATEATPVGDVGDTSALLGRVLTATTSVTGLTTGISAVAVATTPVATRESGRTVASPPTEQRWLSDHRLGWLFASLAIATLAAFTMTGWHRMRKSRRESELQVRALEKRLRTARTVADSEREWLNERNRELQSRVERMARESTLERAATPIGDLSQVREGLVPLVPARLGKRERGTFPRVPPEASRMIDAIDKTADHLRTVEDAAASLVPASQTSRITPTAKRTEPAPSNVRMFRPLKGRRR